MWNWITIVAISLSLASTVAAQSRIDECEVAKASLLNLMTIEPTPPYASSKGESGYFLMRDLFADVLGSSGKSYIINDIQELRFLASTLYRTPILLVSGRTEGFDLKKLGKVLPVAKLQEIAVSLVWTANSEPSPALLELVKSSGGKFWTLAELKQKIDAYVCAPAP